MGQRQEARPQGHVSRVHLNHRTRIFMPAQRFDTQRRFFPLVTQVDTQLLSLRARIDQLWAKGIDWIGSGGGTRTPDTRIMIPRADPTGRLCVGG